MKTNTLVHNDVFCQGFPDKSAELFILNNARDLAQDRCRYSKYFLNETVILSTQNMVYFLKKNVICLVELFKKYEIKKTQIFQFLKSNNISKSKILANSYFNAFKEDSYLNTCR